MNELTAVEGPMHLGIGMAAFRALADATEDCVFLLDAQGCYTAVNREFVRWAGRSEAAVLGRADSDLWPSFYAENGPNDERRVLEGERIEREERRPRDGESRTVRTVLTPVMGEQGAVCGVLGVFHDLTDEEAREDARRRSAQLELVGRMAGGVAHDFNNLLTSVLGHLALLRDEAAREGDAAELLAAAEKAANQAASLSGELLAFLRKGPRRPEPVDVNALVEQTAGLLRRILDPRIQVQVHPQPSLPRVEAVPSQLTQVLLNLCLNARDAMPRGGRLWLETTQEVFDGTRACQHPQRQVGAFVRLRVSDTGEGMPSAVRVRLFEPDFTTKPPGRGTGLGLSIVQQVVQKHQGWIECVSTVGDGACFDVYLPLDHREEMEDE
jgi:PAS domain S-box-containing protein